MFTGIIEEKGTLKEIRKRKNGLELLFHAPKSAKKLKRGDSLAVDGVCLTVTKKHHSLLFFDVIEETVKKTRFQSVKKNDKVNLELPLTIKDFISGHLLLGHIDTTGTIENITTQKITITYPKNFQKFVACKGCIAINGISLTIAEKEKNTFSIALTPYTTRNTNLESLKKGDRVNLEFDLIARYLENFAR